MCRDTVIIDLVVSGLVGFLVRVSPAPAVGIDRLRRKTPVVDMFLIFLPLPLDGLRMGAARCKAKEP